MGIINVDTISGEIRRTSPDKSDSSFTWPLPGFLLWLIWCKWALFYLCFPLFVPCCRVTNLWCKRVELAWELYRDRYIIDMLNDAINSLEFFSLKFVCRILQQKSPTVVFTDLAPCYLMTIWNVKKCWTGCVLVRSNQNGNPMRHNWFAVVLYACLCGCELF